jgi:hypothetical protein
VAPASWEPAENVGAALIFQCKHLLPHSFPQIERVDFTGACAWSLGAGQKNEKIRFRSLVNFVCSLCVRFGSSASGSSLQLAHAEAETKLGLLKTLPRGACFGGICQRGAQGKA